MLSTIEEQRFEQEWNTWFESRLNGPFFKARDENGKWSLTAAMPAIYKFSKLYVEKHNSGFASQSAFSIVISLMVESGDLVPIRDESPSIPADILEFIQKAESGKISTYELRRKYTSDRRFRDAYDIHTGLAALATPPAIQLTADEYHRIPSRTAQMRYQKDPAFKAAVDALHASGRA